MHISHPCTARKIFTKMEVEGQEVRSQMQDLGCNNLSDLDQIIELEHEKFQKQFAAKGKGESDGGLRKMEEIYHLENLRSRFIALSSPSEVRISDIRIYFYVAQYFVRTYMHHAAYQIPVKC